MGVTKGESADVQYFDINEFTFQDGTHLSNIRLAYKDINPQSSKVALIPTCFRGRINTTLTFAAGALRNYRIIVVALFGNGESSSPSNTSGFPKSIDYKDCVAAQYLLLTEKLGVQSLDVMLGFSMGGQCTYYWTAMHPTFIQNAIIICSSARTSRHNYQFLEGPKAALENSVDFVMKESGSPRGLKAFAKAYSAWLTSAEWFDQALYQEQGFRSLQEWDYQVTEANYQDWDPEDILSMLHMWQNGDISKCNATKGNSLEDALAQVKTRILLLPCKTDQYFLWFVSQKEAEVLGNAEFDVIPSIWGHVAGSGGSPQDTAWMESRISKFLVAK